MSNCCQKMTKFTFCPKKSILVHDGKLLLPFEKIKLQKGWRMKNGINITHFIRLNSRVDMLILFEKILI